MRLTLLFTVPHSGSQWVEVLKTFFDEILWKIMCNSKKRWETVILKLRKAKPSISWNMSASVGFDVSSHRNLWTKEPHTCRSILVASFNYAFRGIGWYNGSSTKHLLRDNHITEATAQLGKANQKDRERTILTSTWTWDLLLLDQVTGKLLFLVCLHKTLR